MKELTAIQSKEVVERIQNYKTLSELSPDSAEKAIRKDRLFSSRYNFRKINVLEDKNLYLETEI